MASPTITVEVNKQGISRITVESPRDGEGGLQLLKHSLPALRLFDLLMRPNDTANPTSARAAKGPKGTPEERTQQA